MNKYTYYQEMHGKNAQKSVKMGKKSIFCKSTQIFKFGGRWYLHTKIWSLSMIWPKYGKKIRSIT